MRKEARGWVFVWLPALVVTLTTPVRSGAGP